MQDTEVSHMAKKRLRCRHLETMQIEGDAQQPPNWVDGLGQFKGNNKQFACGSCERDTAAMV
jgi:hypothetical protein